jgi:hypothetical protein
LFVVLTTVIGSQRVEAGVVDNLCDAGEAWDDGRCDIPGYEGASAEAWECGWYMARYWDKRFTFEQVTEKCRRYIPTENVGAAVSIPPTGTSLPPPIIVPNTGCGFNQSRNFSNDVIGTRLQIDCPANCDTTGWFMVYGTGTYTADTSVCYAAIQQGLITQAAGGTVIITLSDGIPLYTGSTSNGITSVNWPSSGIPVQPYAYPYSITLSTP